MWRTLLIPCASFSRRLRMFQDNSGKRYRTYSQYLKDKFGEKIYKVTLNANLGCPNRDGTKSFGGCIFCDDVGSFSQAHDLNLSISEQVSTGIDNLEKRFHAKKFIAYLQSYSNTYGNIQTLKPIYDATVNNDKIVGLSIGTRPDCVDEEKIDLIQTYTDTKEVWIEYGLQSINDKTLMLINRSHTAQEFINAVKITQNKGIKISAHVILGLKGENREDMMRTAKALADLGIDGVKLHSLCILKNSKLEPLYEKGEWTVLEEDEYVDLVCSFMELLPENVIIHRLAGNGYKKSLLAPLWLGQKFKTLNKIDNWFEEHNSWQGKYYN